MTLSAAESSSDDDDGDTAVVAGATVGGLAVLGLLGAVGTVMCKKRQASAGGSKPNDSAISMASTASAGSAASEGTVGSNS